MLRTLSPVTTRYRCRACGNRTRFDVTSTRRTRSFHHYSLGGDLTVENEEVLSEVVEEVACRWCGHGNALDRQDDADAGGTTAALAAEDGSP